jgi:MFS family permease
LKLNKRQRRSPEKREPREHDVAAIFLRWTFIRAVFHRGYVLVALLYFVVDAHLSASQLTLLATAMSITQGFANIPAGAWADAIGRRWPLAIGHLFLAGGMIMTGLVVAFPLIVVTQILWGLGWAFSEGADVAWLTDELDRPDRIDLVLTTRARLDLLGAAIGMVAFGVLASVAGFTTALVVSGAGIAALGLYVTAQFDERNFTPVRERGWNASLSIWRRGLVLAFRDHEILLVFVATMIINAAAIAGWLFLKQLVNLGVPNEPVLWWTAIEILSFAGGAVVLRLVEPRINRVGAARRIYALACFIGVLGMAVVAYASDALIAAIGILLVSGIAFNVTRPVSVVWVNRRTTSEVRATVHSCLSQAESIGEIFGGLALTVLAESGGVSVALVASGALIALAGIAVAVSRADRAPTVVFDSEQSD